MNATAIFPEGSVDHLIARQLPPWLTSAEAEHRQGYQRALLAQQAAADRLQQVLQQIPALDDFALPRLEQALQRAGVDHVEPQHCFVDIKEQFELPSASKSHKPMITYRSRQTLLAAALHNFDEEETRSWFLREAQLTGAKGEVLKLSFRHYAKLCRDLDIGGKYQALLTKVLKPVPPRGQPEDTNHKVVEKRFAESWRTRMRVSVYASRINGLVDQADLQRLLKLLDSEAGTPTQGTHWTACQLYLLGKPVVGVVALEYRPAPGGELEEVALWIPDDPVRELHFHDTWAGAYEALAARLRDQAYRAFFQRFIKAEDLQGFAGHFADAVKRAGAHAPLQLDGRSFPLEQDLFLFLGAEQISKIFADASFMAVPTDVEDRKSRHERLNRMLNAGLDLLNMAAFFVPVLGELMLAVNAAQLLDEVYQGYQAWRLGDRAAAVDHLFNVAGSVALGVASAGAIHAVRRVPFIDQLAPEVLGHGGVRLCKAQTAAQFDNAPSSLLQGLDADRFADVLSTEASTLMRVTGLGAEQLRRLCVEGAPVPARLLDIHARLKLHASEPLLYGKGFEQKLASLREQPSADQALLIRAFKGLTPDAAQEIIEHTSSEHLQALRSTQRLPLSMAERARGYLRENRLDKAGLGIALGKLANTDSERLVLGMIDHHAPWPASVRVELRAGKRDGLLLFASQGKEATQVHTLIRHEQGYAVAEAAGEQPTLPGKTLLQTVLQCLGEQQKTALGDPALRVVQLRDWLLETIAAQREASARLIGLAPEGHTVRPPRRFADGRLGYQLNGASGESSQQAIRRGIHQIFPTLSQLQLDAYLNAVRLRGESLWDHYMMLQRQLSELRDVLQQWQAERRNPFDGIRRRRVADTLRRSWRRKLVDDNDHYELRIDGERVAQLPTLPAGIDFVHVQRLALRNMHLQSIDAAFLRMFPNLVELDLSGNQLTQLPEGIEQLSRLRRLDLGNNQIVLDDAGSLRLARLQRLYSLNLSFNPLGDVPGISALHHVREVSLRGTGQVDLGRVVQNMPLLAHADLRDNRISELHHEVRGLRQRLRQLNLHDNPLNESSAELHDQARGVSNSRDRGSAAYVHASVTADTRTAWIGRQEPVLRAQREATWDRLREEPGSAGLFTFLADFAEGDDFEEQPRHYRRRVWRLLNACESNEVLREQVFREAEAPRSCEDRLLLMLNQMEVAVLVHQGIDGVPVAVRASRLLRLGRQLHRLDLLDAIATRHVNRLRASAMVRVDEIEIRLYYRAQLAGALDLPVAPDEMYYAAFARVTPADLAQAQLEVVSTDTDVAMLDALARRPFWQAYLRETYPERFDSVLEPYHERLEALEATARGGQEGAYAAQAENLMREHQAEEAAMIRNLTTEVWASARGSRG
ncbi:NEL-type E3 ubiquitin ligase domain-containing protein [Pseudomonas sp. TWI628]|uniref:NEL-type E3 ubiquitin ligase domain-containing protein n=1 Tax=Pseudomonas sp. TWI628 TaxID=3136788 RepID=UPI00320A279B